MLSVVPVRVSRKEGPFDLYRSVTDSLKDMISDGDIIVISSKYIANSQGRILDLAKTVPSPAASKISHKYRIEPRLAEIILRESDMIFGGVSGFILASSDGILAPNAGIDKSNVRKGMAILYPDESYRIAENLKRKILLEIGIHVGIIIVDSRLMPARVGTVGVAIACAGFEPIQDLRGQADLDGNPLKVTLKATADNLASIANHKMGEGSESTPIAVIKNSGASLTDRKIRPAETIISSEMCVYVRGFQNST